MSSQTRGAALVAAICALTCANASAATYVVDKTTDDAGADACLPATPNDCSLRSAITNANNNSGPDDITLGAGSFAWTGSPLPITDATTITGAGARATAIDGGGVGTTLLDVDANANVVAVSDLTVRNAGAGDFAPTVDVDSGGVTLTRLAIVDNKSVGLVLNGGGVRLIDSLVARNSAPVAGGVVNQAAQEGFLEVRDSTIAQNVGLPGSGTAPVSFGGGLVSNGGTSVIDSTIAGNRIDPTAMPVGGDNLMNLEVSGFSLNLLRVRNTIVADASANGNCGGQIDSAGHNLDSDGTCGFGVATDKSNVDPQLAALADNGGPTDTRALTSATSPAVDAGAGCDTTDQRGVARPAGGACDIGAFESPFTAPVPVVTPPVTPPANAPAADTTPPVLTVSGIGKTVKRKTFNRGLKVKVGANEPITADLILLAQPRRVTIAKVPLVALATTTLARGGGTRTVTLKPSTKVRGKRKVKMQLRVIAYDAAGNRSAKTVSFTVK
jgi:hypothetical protein